MVNSPLFFMTKIVKYNGRRTYDARFVLLEKRKKPQGFDPERLVFSLGCIMRINVCP